MELIKLFVENDMNFQPSTQSYVLKSAKKPLIDACPGHRYIVRMIGEHFIKKLVEESNSTTYIISEYQRMSSQELSFL